MALSKSDIVYIEKVLSEAKKTLYRSSVVNHKILAKEIEMKKTIVLAAILSLFMVFSVFATGQKEAEASSLDGLHGTLSVATNCEDPTFSAVNEIANRFMEENPGVEVEYVSYTKDYENLMKAKMAANDLPDVFATHGWGVKRYSEYLMPLNELSFAKRFTESILNVIKTPAGNIVTMPVTAELSGIIYNKDILKKAGWDHAPRTWDEFLQSCEDVKALGVVPIYIAGKDTRSQANLMDVAAPTFLTTYKNDDQSQALYDGTFDWDKWSRVAGFLKTLSDRGFLNVDANTADPIYRGEKLAYGEAMYVFQNQAQIASAWDINPDANLSMMPVPVYHEEDTPIMIGGERESYGIWKDTKNKELAVAFLEFMSRPENIKYVCEATSMPTGFSDVDVDLRLSSDFKQYENLRTFPYFDREWLPSGMWATMRSTGGALTAGEITVKQACDLMAESYHSLLSQQQ